MSSSSIIMFGILFAMVLILFCITLNAPKFYNELEFGNSPFVPLETTLKSTVVLQDRNFYKMEEKR